MQNRRFSIHCYPLLFYKVRVRTYVLRIRRTSEEHQYLFGAGWQTLPSGKPQRESCNGKAPTGKLQRESSKHHMPPTCWAHHKKVQPTIQATWMCYNPINTIVHSCSSRAAWAKIAPTGKLQRESSNGRTPTGKLQRESSNGKAPTGEPQRESSNGKAPTGKLQRESILIVAFDSNLICLCREGKRERDIPYSGCPGVWI